MLNRRLVLIRHAQAADGPVDVDRPLTEHGAEQAGALGNVLQRAGLAPDRIVVSPARRAVQTWERAGAQLAAAPEPIVDPQIYDNTLDALLAVVQETPEDAATLVVVGHNPSIGEFARVLDDGEGDPEARSDLERGFPTGTVAVFSLAAPFDVVEAGAGTLTAVATPSA